MKAISSLAILLCLALMLSACGNKGPLTLPDEEEEETRQTSDY